MMMVNSQSPLSIIGSAQAFVTSRSVVTDAAERPFTDVIHLYQHLNYLFRTGGFSKRANRFTASNLFWIDAVDGGSWIPFTASDDARAEAHDLALSTLKREFATSNLAVGGTWKRLFMAYFPDTSEEDAKEIARTIDRTLRKKGLGKLMVAVMHRDQEEPDHLHVLFKWTGRKPRGKARLSALGF